jgi:hypothetical protein
MVGSQRHDQYTPMGEIFMMGDFASGVQRAGGFKRWVSVAVAVLVLCLLLLSGVAALIAALSD